MCLHAGEAKMKVRHKSLHYFEASAAGDRITLAGSLWYGKNIKKKGGLAKGKIGEHGITFRDAGAGISHIARDMQMMTLYNLSYTSRRR